MSHETPQQAIPSAPKTRKFTKSSTAVEAQYERSLQMLRLRDQNTMELRRAGVMMPAARIKELNDWYGYSIDTVDRITLFDEWGFSHPRVAVYSLRSEPKNREGNNAETLGAVGG